MTTLKDVLCVHLSGMKAIEDPYEIIPRHIRINGPAYYNAQPLPPLCERTSKVFLDRIAERQVQLELFGCSRAMNSPVGPGGITS